MVFIYHQEFLNDICIFTSQPKQKFYDELFLSLNLDCLPSHNAKTGRKGICKDNGRSRKKFCRPFKRSKNASCPCNHKNFKVTRKATGCTKYITIPDDYRLSIDHYTITFKSVYSLKTEVERYNSRFKQVGCERVFVRNDNSVRDLNTLAHISL